MRRVGHEERMGEMRNAYSLLIGKPKRNKLFGRPRLRWENNIKMDLMEIGWEDVDWMHVGQDRDQWRVLVNTVMNLLLS
jgi:hypothetical protein